MLKLSIQKPNLILSQNQPSLFLTNFEPEKDSWNSFEKIYPALQPIKTDSAILYKKLSFHKKLQIQSVKIAPIQTPISELICIISFPLSYESHFFVMPVNYIRNDNEYNNHEVNNVLRIHSRSTSIYILLKWWKFFID